MAGTVILNQDGFYGMSADGLDAYIKAIKTDCIETAKKALADEEALFDAIRTGWVGKSEENFEENMKKLIKETIDALDKAETGLEQELNAVAKAWADQDSSMVGRV